MAICVSWARLQATLRHYAVLFGSLQHPFRSFFTKNVLFHGKILGTVGGTHISIFELSFGFCQSESVANPK